MKAPRSPQERRYAIYPPILALVDLLSDTKPQPIGALAERMDVPRRTVEKCVQQLRNDGWPICSGPRGIWKATTRAELEQQYREHRERALTQLRGCRGLRKAMAAMPPEQTTLGLAA